MSGANAAIVARARLAAESLRELAYAYCDAGDFRAAAEYAGRALRILWDICPPDDPGHVRTNFLLASIYRWLGDEAGEEMHRDYYEKCRKVAAQAADEG